jgi:hypothetical protein
MRRAVSLLVLAVILERTTDPLRLPAGRPVAARPCRLVSSPDGGRRGRPALDPFRSAAVVQPQCPVQGHPGGRTRPACPSQPAGRLGVEHLGPGSRRAAAPQRDSTCRHQRCGESGPVCSEPTRKLRRLLIASSTAAMYAPSTEGNLLYFRPPLGRHTRGKVNLCWWYLARLTAARAMAASG